MLNLLPECLHGFPRLSSTGDCEVLALGLLIGYRTSRTIDRLGARCCGHCFDLGYLSERWFPLISCSDGHFHAEAVLRGVSFHI